MNTAEKVLEARMALQMSRYEFADAIHLGKSTIYRWEAGLAKPRINHSARIAALTGKPRLYYHFDD